MQGDPLILMAKNVLKKRYMLGEFCSSGIGLQEPLHANIYAGHPFADYNAAGLLQKTTSNAWSLFSKYFILSSILIVAALGKQWKEGLKIIGVNLCFLLSYLAFCISKGPPKPFKFVSVLMFLGAIGIAYTLDSV